MVFKRVLVLGNANAGGSAFIGNEHVSIQARGLKSNSIYTVWFVNAKPKKHETGAGMPPYMFKTDRWGNGNYSASRGELPFGKWVMVMVVLHPTGDPKDMKNGEPEASICFVIKGS
ncbi:MAG: hypothetical protein SRB2_02638 [Desulfobacteraceae bacterium Eth-SRB2]|nr:MAG: hypothetical protein SRB2_02638 [Desulfobacteraceae bacterium Eth-SRB2]